MSKATGFNQKQGQATQKKLIPAGVHPAKCYSVIDMGTQTESYNGEEKKMHKIAMSFEFPAHTATYKEENGPQVMAVHQDYTFSMSSKANFKQMIDSWIGKPVDEMTDERMQKIVGKAANVQIVHTVGKKNGLTYDNIAFNGKGISPFAKGTPVPAYTPNAQVYFTLSNPDWDVFDGLHNFMKEKIQKCDEWNSVIAAFPKAGAAQPTEAMPVEGQGVVAATGTEEEEPF